MGFKCVKADLIRPVVQHFLSNMYTVPDKNFKQMYISYIFM